VHADPSFGSNEPPAGILRLPERSAVETEVVSSGDSEDIVAWQAAWNTPAHVLESVVRRAAGSSVMRDERILEGHGNEVHAVSTADGQNLIVRISRAPGPVFERESWPVAAVRAVGIPAPEILLIDHIDVGDEEIAIQVQQRMPGRSVYRLFGEISDERLAQLTRHAGQVLAAVHAVRPPGPGPINPQGEPCAVPPLPSEAVIAALVERNTKLVDEGLDAVLLEAPVEAIATRATVLDEAPVCLIHGDWRTTNVLSDGNAVTGVVDWEGARGGDPAFDFAGVRSVRSRARSTSTELLVEGYRAAAGRLDSSFDARRLLYRAADLHSALGHFVATKRPDLLKLAVEDLRATLRELQALS